MFSRHRPRSTSYLDSVKSIIHLHTETLNVWSHLAGALLISARIGQFAATCTDPLAADAIVILVYLAGAAVCFSCSTLYHVFTNHAQAALWQRIDHLSIVILIWASSIPFIHFSFICESTKLGAYMGLVTASAIISLICLWWSPFYHSGGLWSRVGTHVAVGALATLPAFDPSQERQYHALGPEGTLLRSFWALVMANSLGGGIYATNALERSFGRWLEMPDVSHHIMHITVVFGAWVYQQGLFFVYQARISGELGDCNSSLVAKAN